MDVENLDALSPAELDALLEQALNPRVPVEMLYALLERIGAAPQVPPRGAATDRAVRPERPRPPKLPTSAQAPMQPGSSMSPIPPTSQVSPTQSMPGVPGPGIGPGPNPNMQQTAVIPAVSGGPYEIGRASCRERV